MNIKMEFSRCSGKNNIKIVLNDIILMWTGSAQVGVVIL
jgi:hypothetical protein